MAFASSNIPLDSNMFDDPPAEHAERYASDVAPAPGLTPRELQAMSPNRHDQSPVRERSRSHEPGTPGRRVPGKPTSHAKDHLQFQDLPHAPQVVPSTPPVSAYERCSRGPLPGAPSTPPNELSLPTADVRENREQLIQKLLAENAALRASLDQTASEAAQALSMAHASGATVAPSQLRLRLEGQGSNLRVCCCNNSKGSKQMPIMHLNKRTPCGHPRKLSIDRKESM
eukprot:978637-Amphidinium_carterae.2